MEEHKQRQAIVERMLTAEQRYSHYVALRNEKPDCPLTRSRYREARRDWVAARKALAQCC